MTDHYKQRNAEEIEKDINQSRERLDSTLNEIEERFSPQQLLNTSYEYLRHGGANEFVANLGTTIKQNPLPFLVTTAGLGWMMLSQRQPNRSQHQYASTTDQRFYTGGQPSSNTGGPGIPIHEGQRAHRAESLASDFIQEHPLVVGALGFALGAALGGIFPATKKEDEYMGEYRDRVLHKAAETGQAQADKAQHAIHEKAESYKGGSQPSSVNANDTSASDANINAPQNRATGLPGAPTPFAERPGSERFDAEKNRSEQNSPERHSPGLAGSSTPSGNTQGSGTNRTP